MSRPDLLAIAERIVQQQGPDALTMDALAAAAGLSRATVYRQVGSREALLARLAERGLDVGEREDIKTRILNAAGAVFSRLGFDAATIEAIAEAAGVGTATVYRHFGDKPGLIGAFVDAHAPRQAVWRIAHEPSGDLRVDLERLLTTVLEHAAANRDLLRLAFLERARGSTALDPLSRGPDRTVHGITALLRTYQQRGELAEEDLEHMSRALQGLLFGFGLAGPVLGLPGEFAPGPTARFIVRLFLDGMKSRKSDRKRPPTPRRNS